VAVHQEGHIRYVNAAAMRILGATTPESILKRPTRDFVHPTSYSLVTDRIDQIRQSGETLRLVEERLIRVDGSAIEVEVASSPLLYEGKPAILAVFSDVAERKQSEQRKIDLALERERRSVLQQFVTDASHDLRTPLAAMQTAGYLIAKLTEKLADQVNKGHSGSPMLAELQTTVQAIQDRVASSRHNTERLRNLIDAMFEMIRLDRTDALDLKPYSLNALAEDVAEAHRPEAAKKGILFSVEPAPTPPLRMNPIELKRAIQELARNAIQFTPSGGRVTLRTCVVGSETAIEVSDTGPGIDPAVLPAIFKRFYRGDLARGTQSGGNGLGLSIAQRIVELHHGRIEVDSHVGQGSTFRLWLPM
jgi:PAS domain S-box-containing protein